MSKTIDNLAVTTIRTLSIDAINEANSGHPGLPMGAAPMAYIKNRTAFFHYKTNCNRNGYLIRLGTLCRI